MLNDYSDQELLKELENRRLERIRAREQELLDFTYTVRENIDAWLTVVRDHSRRNCSDENWKQTYNYTRVRCLRCALLYIKECGVAYDDFIVTFCTELE